MGDIYEVTPKRQWDVVSFEYWLAIDFVDSASNRDAKRSEQKLRDGLVVNNVKAIRFVRRKGMYMPAVSYDYQCVFLRNREEKNEFHRWLSVEA